MIWTGQIKKGTIDYTVLNSVGIHKKVTVVII